jgi:flagellar M-ring protein FliF
MHRLEELAQAAVGFDARRGDQVVIENVSFSNNSPDVKPPLTDRLAEEVRGLLHSQPGLMRTAVLGLCGVLLVMFVMRPVAGQVTAALREPALLPAATSVPAVFDEERMLDPASEWHGDGVAELMPARLLSKAQLEHQGLFEYVSEHIRREPAQSTRLLEAWIGSTEEAD